jgi:hypothetical protein
LSLKGGSQVQVNQTFHGTVHEVYTVEGTLLLNRDSKPADVAEKLVGLKKELASIAGLEPNTRGQVEAAIEGAQDEVKNRRPNGAVVKGHLDNAAGVLESATGLAEAGRKLAKVLVEIGKWALVFFV